MANDPKTNPNPQSTIYLFDSRENHEDLLPLSFTRPIADFRIGITTIAEKWKALLPAVYRYLPVEYLREKFGDIDDPMAEHLFIAGALIPNPEIVKAVASLNPGEAILDGDFLLAFRGSYANLLEKNWSPVPLESPADVVRHVFDVFLLNPSQIKADFYRLTEGRVSQPLDESNRVIGKTVDEEGRPMIFLEEGAHAVAATINLKDGPVYLGKNSEIMEGSCVRGPLALCFESKIRMGSKIYGGCTFGPFCKVGGEVDNSVFFGFSNKAHDGYLGNAVVGEWCNIGAGVNASNLKNDYTKIRVWNYRLHSFMRTDLQFCGPIIGDHTKLGVNCMLNTATVLGVGVNLHGAGFPRVFVPSFSEGSPTTGFTNVSMQKFTEIAERVLSRRNLTVTDSDRKIYQKVYDVASIFKG